MLNNKNREYITNIDLYFLIRINTLIKIWFSAVASGLSRQLSARLGRRRRRPTYLNL